MVKSGPGRRATAFCAHSSWVPFLLLPFGVRLKHCRTTLHGGLHLRISALLTVAVSLLLSSGTDAVTYRIESEAIAAGGFCGSGGQHALMGTVAQPAVGEAAGQLHGSAVGFWHLPRWSGTGIAHSQESGRFALGQNHPNPFNPYSRLRFFAPRESDVRIVMHDASGRVVATLLDDTVGPGSHDVVIDGSGLASGVYLCRMTSGSFTGLRKLVLVK